MDAIKIYENAEGKLERGKITLGEFEKLIDPLRNVIPIPEGATNGDIIKAMFPNMNIQERNNVSLDIKGQTIEFTGMALKEWWNAPYKGVKNADKTNI